MKFPNPMQMFRPDTTQQQANPQNTQQQQNVQQNTQQQQKPANSGAPDPGGMERATQQKQGGEQSAEGEQKNPLDAFKDLWEPNKVVDESGNSVQQNNQQQQQKPKKPDFAELSKKVDFSLVLSKNPDGVAKALAGDQQAFGQVINQVAQAAFAASGALAHQISQGSVQKIKDEIMASLPAEFKKFSLADTTNPNAAFRHPAMRPIFELIKNQVLEKYPDATTTEIEKQAEDYMAASYGEAFGKSKTGKNAETENTDPNSTRIAAQEAGTFDWNKYF